MVDVGVAGLHGCSVGSTCCAGRRSWSWPSMDGALPSVVAGLVGVPVIGLPTSVGYGASFGGVAALLAMLNACAPGWPWSTSTTVRRRSPGGPDRRVGRTAG